MNAASASPAAAASARAGRPIGEFPAVAELALQQLTALGAATPFEPAEARTIVALMHLQRFAPGAPMLREGEHSEGGVLMLVLAGDVSVDVAELGPGDRLPISVLGPGHLIGEMALLDGAPHSATCAAVTGVTVACLNRHGLDELLAEHPRAAAKLLAAMARSVSERLRAMNDQLRIYARLAGHLQAEVTRLERQSGGRA